MVDSSVPLTRRELREREAAQAVAIPVPTVVPLSTPVPIDRPAEGMGALFGAIEATPAETAWVAPITPSVERTPSKAAAYPRRAERGRGKPASMRVRGISMKSLAGRPPKKPFQQRAAAKGLSFAAMLFAGALVVGMSVPANAFMSATTPAATIAAEKLPTQSVSVADSVVQLATVRDTFTVISYAEQLKLKYGNRSYSFSATTGAVRWPFPYPVPITDGWGDRVSPCLGCSTFHKGVDFTPGEGAPIYAIADGVVSFSEVSDSGLGNYVIIDHVINGQKVQSYYCHMQMNSSPLKVGDPIKVGDFVGLVGMTGSATGPHLHFELHLDGVAVDPFAWLTANAVN